MWSGRAEPAGWPVQRVDDLRTPASPTDFVASAGPRVGDLAGGLALALLRAGIAVGPDRIGRLASALVLIPPERRIQLYWAARLALIADRAQLPVFDAVFAAIFDGRLDPADTRGEANAPPAIGSEPRTRPTPPDDRPNDGATGATEPNRPPTPTPPAGGDTDPDATQRNGILAMASAEQRLHHTSFADLSPQEAEQVSALVQHIVLSTPSRRSRRSRPASRSVGEVDIRRTVKAAQRGGGDVTTLLRRRRRRSRRRLVLLCDVSASMEPYTRVFLSLLQGAVSQAQAEAFVFSTGLTRLTRQLAIRDPGQALARAAAAAPDWAGGTRLAQSLRAFVDDYGRRGLAHGAVMVVLSDGWSLDEPDQVAQQMGRLRRLAFRIIWVNPRKAAAGFAPLVGGMAAALPFCDAFVSGHSLASLDEVAAAIGAESAQISRNSRRND